MKNNMKHLLILLVMASMPYTAFAEHDKGKCKGQSTSVLNKISQNQDYLTMKATIEKHFTRDAYQFIDGQGRILAEVDGNVWRNQPKTEKDGVITLL